MQIAIIFVHIFQLNFYTAVNIQFLSLCCFGLRLRNHSFLLGCSVAFLKKLTWQVLFDFHTSTLKLTLPICTRR